MSSDTATERLRVIPLPPEVLVVVLELSLLDPAWTSIPGRNRRLLSLALLSKQVQPLAYSILYGDLRLHFLAGTADKLRQSLRANRTLAPLVTRLEVKSVESRVWCQSWVAHVLEDAGQLADARRRARTFPIHRVDKPRRRFVGIDDDYDEALEQMLREESAAAWADAGHARWWGTVDGGIEWLQLVGVCDNVKHLVVRDWRRALPPVHSPSARLEPARVVLRQLRTFAAHGSSPELSDFVLACTGELANYTLADYSLNRWTEPDTPHSILTLRLSFDYFLAAHAANLVPAFSQISSLDITTSGASTVGTHAVSHRPSLLSWMTFLAALPSLRTLRIRVDAHEGCFCPTESDQREFAPLLKSLPLERLDIDFWPRRMLVENLPTKLVQLALGPASRCHPPQTPEEELSRSGLLQVLQAQTLTRLEIVGIPWGERDPTEWERRRGDFARAGMKLRASVQS